MRAENRSVVVWCIMTHWLVLLASSLALAGGCEFPLPSGFCFAVNNGSSYAVSSTLSGNVWFESGEARLGNKSFSRPRVQTGRGQDRLGSFKSFKFVHATWSNEIRVYDAFVVFAQLFDEPISGLQVETSRFFFQCLIKSSLSVQSVFSPTPCGYTTRQFADRDCVGVTKAATGFPVVEIVKSEERNFLNFRGYDLIQTGEWFLCWFLVKLRLKRAQKQNKRDWTVGHSRV
jgi:hypothetical protein